MLFLAEARAAGPIRAGSIMEPTGRGAGRRSTGYKPETDDSVRICGIGRLTLFIYHLHRVRLLAQKIPLGKALDRR